MEQTILAVDDEGRFLEYIPKRLGHTGQGRRHLAITVILYSSKNQILIQRRKHQVFNNIWDIGASTHPLHLDGRDETLEEASLRALKEEYGVENARVEEIGSFNYFAKINGLCENEHDHILVGLYDGGVKLNRTKAYEYKWVDKKEFLLDVEKNPKKYTPWAIEGAKILKKVLI